MNPFSLLPASIPFLYVPDGHIGPLPIHPFGVLVATAIVVGHRIASNRARSLGIDPVKFESLVFWTVGTGIVLSHMLDAIFYHPSEIAENPLYLFMIHKGLSSFGGFFGAVVGFVSYTHREKLDRLRCADAICFGLPFAWIFGRMGCATVHDHPGAMTHSPIGVAFPNCQNPGKYAEWCAGLGPQASIYAGTPRYDLGLTELMLTPVVCAIVYTVAKTTRRRGMVVAALCSSYALVRFPLDFLRVEDKDGGDLRYFGLTPGHYASLITLAIGVGVFLFARRLPAHPHDDPAVAAEALAPKTPDTRPAAKVPLTKAPASKITAKRSAPKSAPKPDAE